MKKWIIVIVVVALLGWAVYDFVLSDDSAEELPTETIEDGEAVEAPTGDGADENLGLERGDTAPDFTLETMEGEEVKLSDYRGQKVLLNFWATWCPPCRAEMPDMQKYHEEDAEDSDTVILAVNLTDTEKSESDVDEFLDEYGITFSILSDEKSHIANMYSAQALPTSYLINEDGSIHNVAVGPLNYEAMVDQFNEME